MRCKKVCKDYVTNHIDSVEPAEYAEYCIATPDDNRLRVQRALVYLTFLFVAICVFAGACYLARSAANGITIKPVCEAAE